MCSQKMVFNRNTHKWQTLGWVLKHITNLKIASWSFSWKEVNAAYKNDWTRSPTRTINCFS